MGNALDDERRPPGFGIGRNYELGLRTIRAVVVVAGERTRVVAGIRVKAVIDPLLLHELELPKQARAGDQHDDAVLVRVRTPPLTSCRKAARA